MLDGVLKTDRARIERNLDEISRVEKLVNDLQELMSLENPELVPEMSTVAIDELMQDLATTFSYDVEQKHISVDLEPSGLSLTADANLIRRALSNVMTNAIRHTHAAGSIRLSAQKMPKGVSVSVANTGDVIPDDELDKVFDRLFRGDHARTSPGSGLGLTIARKITELHGGSISISSSEESGTVVTINFFA
jgi:two-component system sensor histidine kinase BaeS